MATLRALYQLRKHGFHEVVSENLDIIRQGLCSLGYTRLPPGRTYTVGTYTWRIPTLGYAGMIAYHAYRRQLLQGQTEYDMDLEVKCQEKSVSVIRDLEVPLDTVKLVSGVINGEMGLLWEEVERRRTKRPAEEQLHGEKSLWQAEPDFRITVCGPADFVTQMKKAMELIDTLPRHRELIFDNIGTIRATRRATNISMSLRYPTVFVGWEVWQSRTPVELAGVLAHEAYHNVLFRESVADRLIKLGWLVLKKTYGMAAEKDACKFESEVLAELGDVTKDHKAEYPAYVGDPSKNIFDLFAR